MQVGGKILSEKLHRGIHAKPVKETNGDNETP
jgi:hypothetical protein